MCKLSQYVGVISSGISHKLAPELLLWYNKLFFILWINYALMRMEMYKKIYICLKGKL